MLQKVGCDGFLGSLAREDHCGVCNGNGKSCKIIKGDFNHTRGAGNYSFNSFQKKINLNSLWERDYMEVDLEITVLTPSLKTFLMDRE